MPVNMPVALSMATFCTCSKIGEERGEWTWVDRENEVLGNVVNLPDVKLLSGRFLTLYLQILFFFIEVVLANCFNMVLSYHIAYLLYLIELTIE